MIKEKIAIAGDLAGAGWRSFRASSENSQKYPALGKAGSFAFLLAQDLLNEAKGQSNQWLRDRMEWIAIRSPALLKTRCHKRRIDGVDCRIVEPKSDVRDDLTIVYFHGGGYVVGSTHASQNTMAEIALASRARVVAVEYRRVPEHPISETHADCLAVAMALAENPGKSIFLMGDSAGGALSVASALMMARLGKSRLAGCVLFSPWTAPFHPETLDVMLEPTDIVSKAMLQRWARELQPNNAEEYARLDFTHADLTGLPPTLVQYGDAEIMAPQIKAFVARARHVQPDLTTEGVSGQFHVFQMFSPLVRDALPAIGRACSWMDERVAK